MTRGRWIQLLSVGVVVAALVGSAVLTGPINQRRRQMGVVLDHELDRTLPPWITLPTVALGSFRGVAIDVLWYRAMRLQEDGKYFEANQLANWITTLQPRYPQVWQYQAWNMAYNISVATHTPEERWVWVNKGIMLLRDKGIVYNPSDVTLYRELGWIFFHKIGKFMDEMHWFYRHQLALEWHQVLGAPPPGSTTEQVIDWFTRIVEAPDTLEELVDQQPATARLIDELQNLDYTLGQPLLRQIGAVEMFRHRPVLATEDRASPQADGRPFDQRLAALLDRSDLSEAIEPFLAWLRKHVLKNHYHMDPQFMLELMQQYGPLDWRHPMSHGCYWSALGVAMASAHQAPGGMNRMTEVDLLNTSRQTIHTMQALTRFGHVAFDPITGRFDLTPDVRFVPAYSHAVEEARQQVKTGAFGERAGESTFDRGHENFLIEVTTVCYLYGDLDQARDFYRRARQLYGDKPQNRMSGRYRKPLAQFVTEQLRHDLGSVTHTGRLVRAMLERAFRSGLAHNQRVVFERFVGLARHAHSQFQKDKRTGPAQVRGRLRLLPFDQVLEETYLSFMQSSDVALLTRCRIWANTPLKLRQRVSERLLAVLHPQAIEAGFVAEKMFPPPQAAKVFEPDPAPESDEAVPVRMERQ